MPQRSNPDTADQNPSIPQEHDDELEMADDDEDFEDDEDVDDDSDADEEDVEE
jgi:hypothetical protein